MGEKQGNFSTEQARPHRPFTNCPIDVLFLVFNCQVCYILLIDVLQLLVFSTVPFLTKAKRISPCATSLSGNSQSSIQTIMDYSPES